MKERKAPYFSIIPAEIKFDDDLSDKAKFLYGDIIGLSNERGFCYANNQYFADMYKVGKTAISNWITQLEKKGYIKREINKKEGNTRKIYPQVGIGFGGYSPDMNRGYSRDMNRSSSVMNRGCSETHDNDNDKEHKNSSINISNNIKTEEEEEGESFPQQKMEIPEEISIKFEQIFNRELSVEFYKKLKKLYLDDKIIFKSLQVAEMNADKPTYLLKILEDWKENNLTSISEIDEYLENRQAKKQINKSKKQTSGTGRKNKKSLDDLYESGYR